MSTYTWSVGHVYDHLQLHFKLLHRQGLLQKCWQNLIHTVVSQGTKLSCFSILLQKAFQNAILEMQVYPVTRPWREESSFYAANSSFGCFFFFPFSVSVSSLPALTNALVKMTILNFGSYAKTPWMRSNVSELFLKTQRCYVSGVCTCLYFWVQQWQYGGKQTAEPSCLSFFHFTEECAPHLGDVVRTNSGQCYFHILCAFPFTRKTKTCLPRSLVPCSKGRKSSLCSNKQKNPQNKNNKTKTTFSSHLAVLNCCV